MEADPSKFDNCASSEEALRVARAQVLLATELLQVHVRRILSGEDAGHAEAEKVARSLLSATQTLISIQVRIDEEHARKSPGEADYTVDLAAERDRIGRLLDRIRSARDAG